MLSYLREWVNADDTGPVPKWIGAAELGRYPGGVIIIGTDQGVAPAYLGDRIAQDQLGRISVKRNEAVRDGE